MISYTTVILDILSLGCSPRLGSARSSEVKITRKHACGRFTRIYPWNQHLWREGRGRASVEGVDLWNNPNHDYGWPLRVLWKWRDPSELSWVWSRWLGLYNSPLSTTGCGPLQESGPDRDLLCSWGISEKNWKLKVVLWQHSQELKQQVLQSWKEIWALHHDIRQRGESVPVKRCKVTCPDELWPWSLGRKRIEGTLIGTKKRQGLYL